jgi:hypothetical protein
MQKKRHFSLQVHRQKEGERAHQQGQEEFRTTSRSQRNGDGFNEGDEEIIFDGCGTEDKRSSIDGGPCQDWDMQEKHFSLQVYRQKQEERAHQ